MARAPDERVNRAKELFDQGMKLIDIAKQLDLPAGTVRRWKSTYKWDSERSEKENERSKRKRGAQPGNKNANGGPPGNRKAEKFGFFSKHLPQETLSIIQEMPEDPLDILWDQIQLAYAAIVRAQTIMYVKDCEDMTTTKIGESSGETSYSEKWEVQQAWDKQGNFLQAQARAQKTLESLIKNYDDLLHKNWELASDEQKARIENIKASTAKIREEDPDAKTEDDGFLNALRGEADDAWQG